METERREPVKARAPSRCVVLSRRSERRVEGHLAAHTYLVRGHAPLEEIRDLLHVLQIHERERISRSVLLRETQRRKSLIGDVLEVLPHVPGREPGDTLAEQILRERKLTIDGFTEHPSYVGLELGVEQARLFRAR